MFKEVLLFPSSNLVYVIPSTIIVGVVFGYFIDTSVLEPLILPTVVLMVYPSMIGLNWRDLVHLQEKKLMVISLLINFLLVPIVAYALGLLFLFNSPGLFAGLAIASLLPTSNMTVAFTMLAKGNVRAAIKLTTTSIILGSFLTPWYLYFMIGQYLPVDRALAFKILGLIIFLPMIMGASTFKYLMTKYNMDDFNRKIKPLLPGICAWGAMLVIFISISTTAKYIFSSPDILASALLVQVLFYLFNYLFAYIGCKVGKFCKEDASVLVYGTVLRYLAISIGLASVLFDYQAVFMVSLAFLIQPLAVVGFKRLNEKYQVL